MGLLDLGNVSFFHGNRQILDQVTLSVNAGDVILVIGPTGSGKSTLLQVMAGVAPQVTGGRIKGKVTLEGSDILHDPVACRGKIGLVLQDPEPQLINLTVGDEIAFGPENLRLDRDEIRARVRWATDACRLTGLENAPVYTLSGGQKQRIAIAAGLAMKPDILLLDGPMTNLDPVGASEVLDTITGLLEEKSVKAVVIVSNKADTLLSLVTRVIVLQSGRIILDGTPEEVFGKHRMLLMGAGLFLPEVTYLWPDIPQTGESSSLPRTAEQAIAALKPLQPSLNFNHRQPAPNNHTSVVTVKGLDFSYGSNRVLRDVSLEIRKAEFLAVVGQNGSGKSTLMSLITGLKKPQSGAITVLGRDTVTSPPQGHVGYVFQYPEHQFVATTVGDELAYGLNNRLDPDEVTFRVNEILTLFGLNERRDESPYTLSVGEKRMLSVATMLVMRPEILILDEPTTGLDRALTETLMQILRRFVEEFGLTVIQVSHDMEQIAEYCSRVIVIDNGTVVFTGPPRELFLSDEILLQTKLEAPPVFRIGRSLFPGTTRIPITVNKFLSEVSYAGT